ncbi:GNAT family N-acetyltransferase [Daejeonella sp.]|uniref:GNAT family N-acetyltransferase n=1 Tax=Daejeonella sp. TaxID=2805397 RepID=UPI003983B962
MKIEKLRNIDIDLLKKLQPKTWTDIRPYFYYYSGSSFCQPLKISENGKIIAVGTNIQHQDSAWLAHIIVHPDHRNRGLGREIASALINDLDRKKISTIYLDATDMGYPVYKRLGFEVETEYIHLKGKHTDRYLSDESAIIPFYPGLKDELLSLDRRISAEDRLNVIEPHLQFSIVYVTQGKVHGGYFPTLLDGFVLAENPLAGTELMKIRMRNKLTARFPSDNQACVDFLIANGYKITGTSKRMVLGEKRPWNGKGIFNRISGGLG